MTTGICACGAPKTPGRGSRYCGPCREKAQERDRAAQLKRHKKWRKNNPEKWRETKRAYYAQNAERERERARQWHHANKERASARSAKYRAENPGVELAGRLRKYGLTVEEYDALLTAQGFACAICRRTENGKRKRFDVDHHHGTGEVRALLCNRCNRLLSNAQDNPDTLRAAIRYLEETT